MSELFILVVFGLIYLVVYCYTIIPENIKKYQEKNEYKRRLETDPVFKLQEEYKPYTGGYLTSISNVWLDSQTETEIVQINSFGSSEFPIYEGPVSDPKFQKIIEVQKTRGQELSRCRECGQLLWTYPLLEENDSHYKKLKGFCFEKCKDNCEIRSFDHFLRSRGGSASMDYMDKKNICKKLTFDKNSFDIIPYYEYAEKQNFQCAICGGKMLHNWDYSGNNYLYHTIDHIKPISRGGLHKSDNIQIVHLICNMVKGTGENIKINTTASDFLKENVDKINNEDTLIEEYRKFIIKSYTNSERQVA